MNEENKTLDISWGTILKIGVAILVFYLIYLIGDILILIIFASIVSILFNSAIEFLQKRGVKRVVAAILVYVVIFGLVAGSVYAVAQPISAQMTQFVQLFPQIFQKIAPPLSNLGIGIFSGSFDDFLQNFQSWLIKASANIFGAISAIFSLMNSYILFLGRQNCPSFLDCLPQPSGG